MMKMMMILMMMMMMMNQLKVEVMFYLERPLRLESPPRPPLNGPLLRDFPCEISTRTLTPQTVL